jgi:hypothetical protein
VTGTENDLVLSAEERAALGTFCSLHTPASRMYKTNIAIASFFTLFFLGPAIAFLIGALLQPGKGMEFGALGFGVIGVPVAIGLGFLIGKLSWRLYLFENGFVLKRGSNLVALWEDVQSYFSKQAVFGRLKADKWLRFEFADGRRVTLDSAFTDIDAFDAAARQGVTENVLARAAEVLPRGQALAFGTLSFSMKGLEKKTGAVSWDDVDRILIEGRTDERIFANALIICTRDPEAKDGKCEWYFRFLHNFPNVDAFLHLASQYTTILRSKDTLL